MKSLLRQQASGRFKNSDQGDDALRVAPETERATVANDPGKRVEEEHAEPNAVNGSIYQSAKAMEVVACGDCRSVTLESAAEAGRTVRPCQRGWPRMAGSGRHPCADASPG